MPGYNILIKPDRWLNAKFTEAYEAEGLKTKNKGKNPDDVKKARDYMCRTYFDVRAFGAVMSTGDDPCGIVRGPVQINFARSISPVNIQDVTITRQARTTDDRKETGDTEMGRKSVIPYALYRAEGYISAALANKSTGLSEEDIELLWTAIVNMFENDHSAARGKMCMRKLYVFKHDNLDEIIRHLAFRDYLRTHKDVCTEYAKLKKDLADKFPYDINGYCDGKDNFVKEHEQKALAWYDSSWDRLYFAARSIQTKRDVSPFIVAGPVAAALMTVKGNIYTGVCIDTACSLGMCAERNAISTMITNGESEITKILALKADGEIIMPCGSCRELMMQLSKDSPNIEVLIDYESRAAVALGTLIPNWWGKDQFS